MNRLSPLIARNAQSVPARPAQGPWRRPAARARGAAPAPLLTAPPPELQPAAAGWIEDVKLFATGWVGGLIFFGTLFG